MQRPKKTGRTGEIADSLILQICTGLLYLAMAKTLKRISPLLLQQHLSIALATVMLAGIDLCLITIYAMPALYPCAWLAPL